MMTDTYEPVRDLVRKSLLNSEGDWHTAEQLCHRWLAEDPVLRAQIAQLCVEWVIRNVITAEGRRQQQQEADRLREARVAVDRDRDIKQTVDEFLKGLQGKDEGETRATS
jgi:hypothetical protein